MSVLGLGSVRVQGSVSGSSLGQHQEFILSSASCWVIWCMLGLGLGQGQASISGWGCVHGFRSVSGSGSAPFQWSGVHFIL